MHIVIKISNKVTLSLSSAPNRKESPGNRQDSVTAFTAGVPRHGGSEGAHLGYEKGAGTADSKCCRSWLCDLE